MSAVTKGPEAGEVAAEKVGEGGEKGSVEVEKVPASSESVPASPESVVEKGSVEVEKVPASPESVVEKGVGGETVELSSSKKYLVSLNFEKDKPLSDSVKLSENGKPDLLVIYNENLRQFNDKSDIEPGSNNGVCRKYRSDAEPPIADRADKPIVLGFPTIMVPGGGFTEEENPTLEEGMNKAIQQILEFVKNKQPKVIVFSGSPDNFELGFGVAKLGDSQKIFVRRKFKELMDQLTEINYSQRTYNMKINDYPQIKDEEFKQLVLPEVAPEKGETVETVVAKAPEKEQEKETEKEEKEKETEKEKEEKEQEKEKEKEKEKEREALAASTKGLKEYIIKDKLTMCKALFNDRAENKEMQVLFNDSLKNTDYIYDELSFNKKKTFDLIKTHMAVYYPRLLLCYHISQ